MEEQFRSSKLRRTIDREMLVSPHHEDNWEAYTNILAAKFTLGDDERHNGEKKLRLLSPGTSTAMRSLYPVTPKLFVRQGFYHTPGGHGNAIDGNRIQTEGGKMFCDRSNAKSNFRI